VTILSVASSAAMTEALSPAERSPHAIIADFVSTAYPIVFPWRVIPRVRGHLWSHLSYVTVHFTPTHHSRGDKVHSGTHLRWIHVTIMSMNSTSHVHNYQITKEQVTYFNVYGFIKPMFSTHQILVAPLTSSGIVSKTSPLGEKTVN